MAESVLICIGNPARSDDGVGPAVADAIRRQRPDIPVRDCRGEPLDLVELFADASEAVVVDAMLSGTEAPGTVTTIDATHAPVPIRTQASSHGLGLADALELARSLGRLPVRLVVIGVEAATLEPGTALSPAVAAAVPRAVDAVLAELGHA